MDKAYVLMTGYLGYIGSLIRHNIFGFEWIGYDLKEDGDILNTDKLVNKLKGVEACVHLAAIPAPLDLPWESYQKTNIDGTLSVIQACVKAGVKKLIYMSSGAVYGFSNGSCIPDQFPIKEENAKPVKEKLHFYDISKLECEKHLEEATKKYDLNVIVFRIDSPQGLPPASILENHMFTSITPTNLAEGIRAALDTDFKGFGVFNIFDPFIPQINTVPIDIQGWIKQRWSNVPNYTQGRESLMDISKAREILGYNPR